jgi:hypothetical protein
LRKRKKEPERRIRLIFTQSHIIDLNPRYDGSQQNTRKEGDTGKGKQQKEESAGMGLRENQQESKRQPAIEQTLEKEQHLLRTVERQLHPWCMPDEVRHTPGGAFAIAQPL